MRRSDVQFKAKADTALFDEAPVIEATEIEAVDTPEGWLPLPEVTRAFPYDGQPVWLTSDGRDAQPATWRVTRAYDAVNVKWTYRSYWARHNAGGQQIEFTPIGYKKMED